MAKFELKLPKMGESVAEATLNSWLKDIGDHIDIDEAVVEISTDKVDSDVPSEVSGTLVEKKFEADQVVEVGQTIAIIETEGGAQDSPKSPPLKQEIHTPTESSPELPTKKVIADVQNTVVAAKDLITPISSNGVRFYSPLVKNIAKKEGVSQSELDQIEVS